MSPDQDTMTVEQKREFWAHVADVHQDVLMNKYSQQPYQPKEEKVSFIHCEGLSCSEREN